MRLKAFCEDIVHDFTPLGGNRPDCAVVSGAAVSLSDVTFSNTLTVGTCVENPLPLDVFACAAGILCSPVIITGDICSEAAKRLCERRGPTRTLSILLRYKSEKEMHSRRRWGSFPWEDKKNDYHSVFVKVELPSEVVTLPDYFLEDAPMVRSIDLRSTRLTALGNDCMRSWQLSQVHLPSTVTSIGSAFLQNCPAITSIDIRHLTGLVSLGKQFMTDCATLTELLLPPSVTQIDNSFVGGCPAIKSIDLRHLTGLTSLSVGFLAECDALAEVYLPPSVTRISNGFLYMCSSMVSIDLRHLTGLTSVGDDFMAESNSLKEVHLPGSLVQLPEMFLESCRLNPVCHWGSRHFTSDISTQRSAKKKKKMLDNLKS